MKPNQVSLKYSEFLRNGFVFALPSAPIPTTLVIGWGEWRRSSKPGPCSIFAPDFYMTDQEPWFSPESFDVMTRAFFTTNVLPSMAAEVKEFRWVEPSLEVFEAQVQAVREAFQNEGLQKAVPVVHARAREIMTQDRLALILHAMSQAPASLIPHGFWQSSRDQALTDGLLGATPERLFSIEGSKLSTMALAGTRAKTGEVDDAQVLFDDPKERREHQIVIDDLKEHLSKYGEVSIGETFVAELPTLFHLKTPIEVSNSNGFDFTDLARDLHPTPALGVAPRSFDFQNMRRWDEAALRGRFGAPFGLRLKSDGFDVQDCLVAIRNVQWSKGLQPTLGSGCGFVSESITPREWDELQLKRDSVKKVLRV